MSTDPSGLTVAEQETIRSTLIRWRPLVVVVIPEDVEPGTVAALTATLGFPPTRSNGAWVWHLTPSTTLGPLTPP